MSVWGVAPETVKVELTYHRYEDGQDYPFWIRIKKLLNIGEKRGAMTRGFHSLSGSGDTAEIGVDWEKQSFARTAAYLAAWNLEDDGAPRPLDLEHIKTLHEDVYTLIENAINAHVAAQDDEKKARAGKSDVSPT